MPRQPKTITPVRIVRDATGMKQEDFAAFLGLRRAERSKYQRIENGREKPGADLKYMIMRATGADLFRASVPLDLKDRPYTKESFKEWQQRPNRKMPPAAWAERLAGWMEVLFEAAEAVENTRRIQSHRSDRQAFKNADPYRHLHDDLRLFEGQPGHSELPRLQRRQVQIPK
jgi:transcriptional regulator with XRE-family HTH domain